MQKQALLLILLHAIACLSQGAVPDAGGVQAAAAALLPSRVTLALCAVCAGNTSELQEGNELLPDRLRTAAGLVAGNTASSLQTRAVPAAGVYKAQSMRVNPRLRTLKSIYKTYVDIIHVSRDEQSKLFSVKTDTQSQSQTLLESTQQPDAQSRRIPCFRQAVHNAASRACPSAKEHWKPAAGSLHCGHPSQPSCQPTTALACQQSSLSPE